MPAQILSPGVSSGIYRGYWYRDSCFSRTQSANLRKNLKDCEKLLVFAATLGAGAVDHLIQRYTKIQMSKAVILQAAAAAMLEDYCDEVNEQIRRHCREPGIISETFSFQPWIWGFSIVLSAAVIRLSGGREADRNHIDRQLPDGSVQVGDSGDRCQSAFQNLYG